MSHKYDSEINSASFLLKRLCCKITQTTEDSVLPHYQYALQFLGSSAKQHVESDEIHVVENIKKKLVRQGRVNDAVLFLEFHRKLQTQDILKSRSSILQLFLSLSDSVNKTQKKTYNGNLFEQGLPSYATSTPYNQLWQRPPSGQSSLQHGQSHEQSAESGISSIHGNASSNGITPEPQSFRPSMAYTPGGQRLPVDTRTDLQSRLALSRSTGQSGMKKTINDGRHQGVSEIRRTTNTCFEVPEAEIIKDLVYVFQGIDGKWIKYDSARDSYRVDTKAGIPKSIRQLVGKLAECGWLFMKIKTYVESRSTDKAFGLVGQSFCAALHQELTEYYRLIAVLEAQLQQEEDQGMSPGDTNLTLRRLVVWTFDPMVRLKALAALVDICKGKKGGALASSIHSYMQHGDPYILSLIKQTLTMVVQPIYVTLLRWISDGELEDMYDEFFVASDPTVMNDKLWHEKYTLRKTMIPSFITIEQARRILLTGKTINFLRQVCFDRTDPKGRDTALSLDASQAEFMLSQNTNSTFQNMIDEMYKETSQHLLHILYTKYKFMDHLKAMRRYLLLGQGDFICHLMDLLEEDLAKPAGNLYLHNLSGILETAIHATNARYDDSDILKRLDVKMLEVSPGDTGWDVFSLVYHVDGPIRTVFTNECIIMYLRAFNFLWRAKRMEYILAMIWRNQSSNARVVRSIKELSGVLHQCHLLGYEMVHFIQQVQYYINFEVLECAWDELLTRMRDAADLDHIIAAQQVFLDTIISRCLLNEKSRSILTQLRTIFDLIIDFQVAQASFYDSVNNEVAIRQDFEKKMKQKSEEGEWAITEGASEEEKRRKLDFLKSIIPSTRARLTVLSQSYQDMVHCFLGMLSRHQDVSLQFLGFRLDFNQHYKTDPKLSIQTQSKQK